MMRAQLRLAVALLALGTFAGCVSLKRTSEARFFALRPAAEAREAPVSESAASIVGVLPVFLPAHLQRPQFVAWSGPGELRIDEFLRWTDAGEVGPAPGRWASGLSAIAADRHAYFTWTFEPGTYVVICYVSDDGDGKPHYLHGMVRTFTVI